MITPVDAVQNNLKMFQLEGGSTGMLDTRRDLCSRLYEMLLPDVPYNFASLMISSPGVTEKSRETRRQDARRAVPSSSLLADSPKHDFENVQRCGDLIGQFQRHLVGTVHFLTLQRWGTGSKREGWKRWKRWRLRTVDPDWVQWQGPTRAHASRSFHHSMGCPSPKIGAGEKSEVWRESVIAWGRWKRGQTGLKSFIHSSDIARKATGRPHGDTLSIHIKRPFCQQHLAVYPVWLASIAPAPAT